MQALQNYTNVVAPLDGVMVWRYADTGALIQGGTNSNEQDLPIVRLSQSELLRLRIPVPERRCEVCARRRSDAGASGCDRPLIHRKDRALYARREL